MFKDFQWDVNWTNPEVFFEHADIVLWLASIGVEVIRLDAIAFLWKRKGTNCHNQTRRPLHRCGPARPASDRVLVVTSSRR
jgi:glycosidase